KDHVVLGTGGGWGPDWPEPDGFFEQVVTSGAIHAQTYNTGLLGITKEQAKTLGANFPAGGVPSVDADFAACAKMAVGSAERLTCWENLDKKLTTEIVPWVPYRWSKRVDVLSAAAVGFDSDPYSSEISLAHIGIDTAKQVLS